MLIFSLQFGEGFEILWFTCHYLMFTNAALNPLIYGLTNEGFRRAFQTAPLSRWLFTKKEGSKSESGKRRIWTLPPRESMPSRMKLRFNNYTPEEHGFDDCVPGKFKLRREEPEQIGRNGILYM